MHATTECLDLRQCNSAMFHLADERGSKRHGGGNWAKHHPWETHVSTGASCFRLRAPWRRQARRYCGRSMPKRSRDPAPQGRCSPMSAHSRRRGAKGMVAVSTYIGWTRPPGPGATNSSSKSPIPPSWRSTRAQRFLYAVHADLDEVSAYAIDKQTGRISALNRQSCGGKNPVHLCIDPTGRWI